MRIASILMYCIYNCFFRHNLYINVGNTLYAPNKEDVRERRISDINATTARKTTKAKNRLQNVQIWTINTLYYRAKHHPYRTEEMEDAMTYLQFGLIKCTETHQ